MHDHHQSHRRTLRQCLTLMIQHDEKHESKDHSESSAVQIVPGIILQHLCQRHVDDQLDIVAMERSVLKLSQSEWRASQLKLIRLNYFKIIF